MEYIGGIFQDFDSMPEQYHAIYYYDPQRMDILVFDLRLKANVGFQQKLRSFLLEKLGNLISKNYWISLGPLEIRCSLADVGLSIDNLMPRALPAPDQKREVEVIGTSLKSRVWGDAKDFPGHYRSIG